jgi:hypothetical protein
MTAVQSRTDDECAVDVSQTFAYCLPADGSPCLRS